MNAKVVVVVGFSVFRLKVELQVTVAVEKDHVAVMAHKTLEYRGLRASPDVVVVDAEGVAAAVLGPHVLENEAALVPVGLKRLIEPLKFFRREQRASSIRLYAYHDKNVVPFGERVIKRLASIRLNHALDAGVVSFVVSRDGVHLHISLIGINAGLIGREVRRRSALCQVAADAREGCAVVVEEREGALKVRRSRIVLIMNVRKSSEAVQLFADLSTLVRVTQTDVANLVASRIDAYALSVRRRAVLRDETKTLLLNSSRDCNIGNIYARDWCSPVLELECVAAVLDVV